MGGRRAWDRLLKFRCTGCGNCCRNTLIPVNDADVRRLMEATARPPGEFVRFARDIDMPGRHGWWVRFRTPRQHWTGMAVLRWRKNRCIFLEGDRCTVYSHRPLVCRMHPFDLTLRDDDSGPMTSLQIGRPTECPNDWDGDNSRRELGLLERLMWRESAEYVDRIAAWNRRRAGDRSVRAFLTYLFAPAATAPRSAAPSIQDRIAERVVSA